jgi:FixJ family two-component response regulator
VDDDAEVRLSLADLLLACGYRVEHFESAEDLLGSTDRNECACALVDIDMPRMSGLEFLEEWMSNSSAPPVIVMTALSEEVWRARALRSGAAGFLQKPFPLHRLLDLLAEFGPRPRRQERSQP